MSVLGEADRLPIISHWGITGGDFYNLAKNDLHKVELSFLQTYSFLSPVYPQRAKPVIDRYVRMYSDAKSARDIFAPVGTAHAYDLVHLLSLAIEKAGSLDRIAIRSSLENLPTYKGLLRDYSPAFSSESHDALDQRNFTLSRYGEGGVIVQEHVIDE